MLQKEGERIAISHCIIIIIRIIIIKRDIEEKRQPDREQRHQYTNYTNINATCKYTIKRIGTMVHWVFL